MVRYSCLVTLGRAIRAADKADSIMHGLCAGFARQHARICSLRGVCVLTASYILPELAYPAFEEHLLALPGVPAKPYLQCHPAILSYFSHTE
jgi:hypothetical protein